MSGSLLICFVSKFAKIQLRESAFSSCACLFSVLVLIYVEILYHDWTSHKTFLICRQNCRFSPNLKTNCPISWSGKGPVVQKAPKFLMEARMCWSFHMSHKKGCTLYWLPDLCKGNRIEFNKSMYIQFTIHQPHLCAMDCEIALKRNLVMQQPGFHGLGISRFCLFFVD